MTINSNLLNIKIVFVLIYFSVPLLVCTSIGEQGKLLHDVPFSRSKESKSFFTNFYSSYLPNLKNVSMECRRDLLNMINTLSSFGSGIDPKEDIWILQMIDSWGKWEDGLLQGNSKALGFFHECLKINSGGSNPVEGQYCLISYTEAETSSLSNPLLPPPDPAIAFLVPTGNVYSSYATCMPSSCTQDELVMSINEVLLNSGKVVRIVHCQIQDPEIDLDASEIFGIVFFSLIACLLTVASVFDIVSGLLNNKLLREKMAWLLAFSVPTNIAKIFVIEATPPSGYFTCVHGIRVLSIVWVLISHQYIMSVSFSSNSHEVVMLTEPFWVQILANGYHCVDTFFALGGFFVAHSLWKSLDKRPHFPALTFYIHRIIRLTPAIAMAACFIATMSSFLVEGPMSLTWDEFYVKGCRRSWWVDVTYSNNFFNRFGLDAPQKQGEVETCLLQCWYTAVDMQIYIFMPIILLPVFFWEKRGVLWLSAWTFISVLIPALIIGLNDLWPTTLMSFDFQSSGEFQDKVYMMPYCRINAYLAGIWGAYILRRIGNENKPKISQTMVAVGWVVTFLVAFALVFGLYPYNHLSIPPLSNDIGPAVSVIYGSLSGLLWGGVVSWVLLACYWGYGGFINTFLSHPVFHPMSRLTYCIFLVHLPLIMAMGYSTVRPIYFSHINMITAAMGSLFYSFVFALLLNLISESPVMRLEKLLFKR